MNRSNRTIHILLATIAFLLGANLLVQSHQDRVAQAAGGLPDTGAQLQAQIDQLQDIGKKIDRLQTYIESGKMVVNVKDPKPAAK